ncbi:MAG: response regulator, partial [Gammaproteobacteria bacterium]|nr:response regulator [Gammaproteobacteria bacterium]
KKMGCNVIHACDGDVAISLYQQYQDEGRTIDVIIVDLNIPGSVSNKEFIKIIRNMNPDASLIVSSGDSLAPEMTQYHDYGYNGALEKSFDRKIIRRVLERILSNS